MELRKDPITRSWVALGYPDEGPAPADSCPLCPGHESESRTLLALPGQDPWQVRVFPHFNPLYRIEGDPGRQADGIYDRMRAVGAHEVIRETPQHDRTLSAMPNKKVEGVVGAYALRIRDLRGVLRFKYVTVLKNLGAEAGEEWPPSHSQLTATTFVPRRVLYELRASREWYQEKERCVFCDIVRQEERQGRRIVDSQGEFVALCPYASRVPYELWLINRRHNHL